MKSSIVNTNIFKLLKFIKILLIIMLPMFQIDLNARELVPDKIYVHFDKSFYLVGEKINFKIYFQNSDTIISKIVHVDLIDHDGRIIMNQILEIDRNSAFGSYDIPYNLLEANYLFRCYTKWNLNFGRSKIYYNIIPIYDEFLDDSDLGFAADTTADTVIFKVLKDKTSNGLHIKIKNEETIHRGDLVELEIRTRDDKNISVPANLSLSVLEGKAFVSINPKMFKKMPEYPTDLPDGKELLYESEESITIKGVAIDPETGEILRSRVLSIYNVKEATFTRLSSQTGNFEFKLPLFNGSVNLQIINMNPFQAKVPEIEWIPLEKELPVHPDFSPIAIQSDIVKEYIFYARLRNRINEIFYASAYDSIQLQQPPILPFIPDKSFDMTKYQLIRDLLNFFKEGVIGSSFYKENGMEKIRLLNDETKKYFMTSPWFVVDGHFIFNDSLVHHMPFNHLSRIDIYNTNESILKYFDPIMIQGGVVAVYTKNNFLIDYIANMPNTLRVDGIPEIVEHNISFADSDHHETPDFSPLIYWNGNIRTDQNGRAAIAFTTNDVTGPIIIEARGIDNSGRLLSGYLGFEVKR